MSPRNHALAVTKGEAELRRIASWLQRTRRINRATALLTAVMLSQPQRESAYRSMVRGDRPSSKLPGVRSVSDTRKAICKRRVRQARRVSGLCGECGGDLNGTSRCVGCARRRAA